MTAPKGNAALTGCTCPSFTFVATTTTPHLPPPCPVHNIIYVPDARTEEIAALRAAIAAKEEECERLRFCEN